MQHHEQSLSLQEAFKRNVQALVSFREVGNPLEDDERLVLHWGLKIETVRDPENI